MLNSRTSLPGCGEGYLQLYAFVEGLLEAEHGSAYQTGEGGFGEVVAGEAHLHVPCSWVADEGSGVHQMIYNSGYALVTQPAISAPSPLYLKDHGLCTITAF